jgi:hypothetical protein
MTTTPLAVIVKNRPSGKLVEYRGFVSAITEPGYLEQLVSNPSNEVLVVQDSFQCPTRTVSRREGPTKSRRLYDKPRHAVAALGT